MDHKFYNYACIINDNRILFIKNNNKWTFPGRLLTDEETDEYNPDNIIERMVREQVNIDVFRLFNIYYKDNDSYCTVSYCDYSNFSLSKDYYVCVPLNMKRFESNYEYKWFTKEELINIEDEDERKLALDTLEYFKGCNTYGEIIARDHEKRNFKNPYQLDGIPEEENIFKEMNIINNKHYQYACIIDENKILFIKNNNIWTFPGRGLTKEETEETDFAKVIERIVYDQFWVNIFKLFNIYYNDNKEYSNLSYRKEIEDHTIIDYYVCVPLNMKDCDPKYEYKWFRKEELIDIEDETQRKLALDTLEHFKNCKNYTEVMIKDHESRNIK